jgi:hypothetical protein
MCGVRDIKIRNYLKGEQKELAQILIQYMRCGYGAHQAPALK